jgi:hypothetical protein
MEPQPEVADGKAIRSRGAERYGGVSRGYGGVIKKKCAHTLVSLLELGLVRKVRHHCNWNNDSFIRLKRV